MSLRGRDLITVDDLGDDEVLRLLALAKTYAGLGPRPRSRTDLEGFIIATLFFEPSTRTRLSFDTAAHRLGARVIGFPDPRGTSAEKGETFDDTMRVVGSYADLVILRHPQAGSAQRAADLIEVPVVNAGDGPNAHPTQALLDLYTIREERKRIDGNHVVLLGDLKFGRTVHSLALLLARFGNTITCVSPPGLEMPPSVLDACAKHGPRPVESRDLKTTLATADVVYATRVQKERFTNPAEHAEAAGAYRVDPRMLAEARPDITILHPLPRVDELDPATDPLAGAAYFRQAKNGVPVRMAVLSALLQEPPA